jgi:hypothetical protein
MAGISNHWYQVIIAGNEIADQLAKEAAKESMSLNEQYNVISMSDVKQGVLPQALPAVCILFVLPVF